MSWLSSLGNSIGNIAKKVGSAVGSTVKTVATVAKAAVVPLASFAAGLVPGVGPLLSAGVDMLGNKLMGGGGAETMVDTAPSANDLVTMTADNATMSLGSSPAAQALASANSPEKKGILGTLSDITGIGDGKPGVFGIGDGKPGIAGIGTGKAKAKKEAADAARQEAERLGAVDQLSPIQIKLKGDEAAAAAEQKVEKHYAAGGTGVPKEEGGNGLLYAILAVLGLAIL